MALNKEIEIAAYGVVARHHVVAGYGVDLRLVQCVVSVECYASVEACLAGKNPLARESITINERPPADAPTLAWVEDKLCEAETAPTTVVGEIQPGMSMPQMFVSPNRWLFSGALRV